jgi:hypothetical protein
MESLRQTKWAVMNFCFESAVAVCLCSQDYVALGCDYSLPVVYAVLPVIYGGLQR